MKWKQKRWGSHRSFSNNGLKYIYCTSVGILWLRTGHMSLPKSKLGEDWVMWFQMSNSFPRIVPAKRKCEPVTVGLWALNVHGHTFHSTQNTARMDFYFLCFIFWYLVADFLNNCFPFNFFLTFIVRQNTLLIVGNEFVRQEENH